MLHARAGRVGSGARPTRLVARSHGRAQLYITAKVDSYLGDGRVSLRLEEVRRQIEAILARLQTDYIDLLLLQNPDNETPIELALQECAELHEKGQLRQLGLSNYAAWQVPDAYHTCDRQSWLLPSVYQGTYNVVMRHVEAELIPCLRHLGMALYACSPLAAGWLTREHPALPAPVVPASVAGDPITTRAVRRLRDAAGGDIEGVISITLKWSRQHSMLDGTHGDAVVLGAATLEQLADEPGVDRRRRRISAPEGAIFALDATQACSTRTGARGCDPRRCGAFSRVERGAGGGRLHRGQSRGRGGR